MTSKRRLLMLFLPWLMVCAHAQEPPRTPQQLVELSRRASDLSEIGPYRLEADIVFKLGTPKEVIGHITILRDKGHYRSEVQLSDYRETRWINDNVLTISRTRPIPVPKMALLRQLDRLWRPYLLSTDLKTSKMFKKKQHSKDLDCFEIIERDSSRQRWCFDSSTSVLVAEDKFEFHGLEFQDFSTIEGKYFPKQIIFRERDRVVLEVKDISISKTSLTGDLFVPPAGIAGFATCDDPTPPHIIKNVIPDIPKEELSRMRSGTGYLYTVYLYGIIGTSGSVQSISVEYSPRASFTESAVEAFKQRRFAPAMCSDKAVPAELEMYTNYYILSSIAFGQ
jgi:hypothetical protein